MQVPCGETFHCELQWVAQKLDSQHTRLRISASVVFDMRCWLKGTVMSKSKEVRWGCLPCQGPAHGLEG